MALEAPSSADLSQLFELRHGDTQEIARFISDYTFLSPILIEAHNHLERYFGNATQALELVTDPDDEQDSRHLVIYAVTDKAPRAALETLDRFDRDWFLDAVAGAQGKLSVNVELRH